MGDAAAPPSPAGGDGPAGIVPEVSPGAGPGSGRSGAVTPETPELSPRRNVRRNLGRRPVRHLVRRLVPWIWICCGLALLALVGRGMAGATLGHGAGTTSSTSVAGAGVPIVGTALTGRPGASPTVGSAPSTGALPTVGPTPLSNNQRVTLARVDPSATTGTSSPASTSPDPGGSEPSVSPPPAAAGSPIISVQSGACLNVAGGSTADFTRIDLSTCTGGAAQAIRYTSDSELRVLGKCVDAMQQGTVSGTPIILYTCNGQQNQQWSPEPNGAIRGVQSNLCLNAVSPGTGNGTLLELGVCTGGTDQAWIR